MLNDRTGETESFEKALRLLTDEITVPKGMESVFRLKTYASSFEKYHELLCLALSALDEALVNAGDQQAVLLKFGGELFKRIARNAEGTGKSILDDQLNDTIYLLIAFTVPSLRKSGREYAESLAQLLVDSWNERFPKRKIKLTTYEGIADGFKKRPCYITTAVCQTLRKEDRCSELMAFRTFRDQQLMKTEEGRRLVRGYYLLAPEIVEKMNAEPNREAVYAALWNQYLSNCYTMLMKEQYASCAALYQKMVEDLAARYLQ